MDNTEVIFQTAFLAIAPFFGGWAGAQLMGTRGTKAALAAFIASLLAGIISFAFTPGGPAIFGSFAVASVIVGLLLRMDSGEIGGLAIGLIFATIAGMLLVYRFSDLTEDLTSYNYYDCENMKSEILAISKENRDQTFGIYMIGIVEESELSKDETETKCRGTAIYSNTTKTKVTYRAYREYDQWWLEAQPTF